MKFSSSNHALAGIVKQDSISSIFSELTTDQKQILKRTFDEFYKSNAMTNGAKVFLQCVFSTLRGYLVVFSLLQEHPKYKQMWPMFRELNDSELMGADQLKHFSKLFMCDFTRIS